ncbi:MAG: hypothetical protein WCH09_08855 [Bacteroidota bacterium]
MAILATEKVLTLDYWKPAHKLQVGDYVFDKDGFPRKVTLVQEYRANNCYRINFDDHLTAAGDDKLGFLVETPKYRKRLAEYKGRFKFRRPLKFLPVQDLLTTPLKTKTNRWAISVPTTQPIALPTQPLSIPPFVFAYWFVNRKKHNQMTFLGQNEDYVTQKFQDAGYKVTKGWYYFSVTPSIESQLAPNLPRQIPTNYLMGSPEQRMELLRGFIHGKPRQYSVKDDRFRITSISFPFISQIQALVESLGMKTTLSQIKAYTISFKSRHTLVENQRSPKMRVHVDRRYIRSIDSISDQMCVHVETDGQNNTILVGEGFIPCH